MKILKRIAVWILAFVMFFIPSVPLGVSAAETADKIQVDHDKSNDTYFVHDTNIVLFCFVWTTVLHGRLKNWDYLPKLITALWISKIF